MKDFSIKEILGYDLFSYNNNTIEVLNLVSLIGVLIIAFVLQFFVRKVIYRLKNLDESKKYAVYRLFQYFFWVVVALVSLQSLGIQITVVLGGLAALLVGFGLGMQYLFSDFISGIVLLLDGSLKVNDVIEVDGKVYKVQEINFRTTTVIGRDENYIVVPNSHLTSNKVTNWTYKTFSSRFQITVGVDYSSDVPTVMKIIQEAAAANENVLKSPKPFARFEDYGDSSLDFSVYFWSKRLFEIENIKSDIRVDIFKRFKEQGISIPFPQRVVHYAKDKK